MEVFQFIGEQFISAVIFLSVFAAYKHFSRGRRQISERKQPAVKRIVAEPAAAPSNKFMTPTWASTAAWRTQTYLSSSAMDLNTESLSTSSFIRPYDGAANSEVAEKYDEFKKRMRSH